MLANRLVNRFRHFSKWARRQGITCFRLYEKDIPDYPIVVDWYDGDVVAWFMPRTKDDSLEKEVAYRRHAEAEILRSGQVHGDTLALKRRGNHAGGGFKTDPLVRTGQPLDETSEAARAIAAHLSAAAIAVVEIPAPIRGAGGIRNQQHQAVRPNPALAVAEMGHLFGRQRECAIAIVDQHKVVARAVHLGELQTHAVGT